MRVLEDRTRRSARFARYRQPNRSIHQTKKTTTGVIFLVWRARPDAGLVQDCSFVSRLQSWPSHIILLITKLANTARRFESQVDDLLKENAPLPFAGVGHFLWRATTLQVWNYFSNEQIIKPTYYQADP